MNMQLGRDDTLVSLNGLSVAFRAGVVTHVPPRLIKEAVAFGCVAAQEDKAAEAEVLAAMSKEKDDLAARKPAIAEAIKTMVARNQRGDFTAAARPNLNVLMSLTGLAITAQELDPIWNEIKAEMA